MDICVCNVCDFCWVFAGSCLQLGLIKKIPYPFGSSFQSLTLQILSHWTARFLTVAQVSSDVLAGGLGYVAPVKKNTYSQKRNPLRKLCAWMSQEVKRLGSVGYNPNITHLQVGYNPFTNHGLTSWDIQVCSSVCGCCFLIS